MNLNNFETYVRELILDRGYDYYYEGLVNEFNSVSDGKYQALVQGTHMYNVEVELDAYLDVIDYECDCPYDGDICKHVVAVLYELRDHLDVKVKTIMNKQLKPVLENLSKEELINLVIRITENNIELEKEILLQYANDEDNEIELAVDLIESSLRSELSDGFVVYNRVTEALEGVYSVLHKIDTKLEQAKIIGAIELCLVIFRPLYNFWQYCDDSFGEVGSIIDTTANKVGEILYDFGQLLNKNEQDHIYQLITNEIKKSYYNDYSDTKLELLKACFVFEDKLDEIYDILDQWLLREENRFYITEIKAMQLNILELTADDKTVEEFIIENLKYDDVREMAIKKALEKEDYDRVLKLCQEVSNENRKWKEYQFIVYKKLNDIKNQKLIAKELLLYGDYSYYQTLKALYSKIEWEKELNDILNKIKENTYVYKKILIEEDLKERLLDFCKDNDEILELYPYLIEQYRDQTRILFVQTIKRKCKPVKKRSYYRYLAQILLKFRDLFGQEYSHHLVNWLTQEYKRRSAFLEELKYAGLVSK